MLNISLKFDDIIDWDWKQIFWYFWILFGLMIILTLVLFLIFLCKCKECLSLDTNEDLRYECKLYFNQSIDLTFL